MLHAYLLFSAALFLIAIFGILRHRANVLSMLMCVELLLLAVNTNLIASSYFLGALSGQIFVFFVLTLAACESAIGLALIVILYRQYDTVSLLKLSNLKH